MLGVDKNTSQSPRVQAMKRNAQSQLEPLKRASKTQTDFEHESSKSPSPTRDSVLKVDTNCLNCSGNMTHAIRGVKTACLMYTQGKIPY